MTAYPPPLNEPLLALLQNQLAAIIQRQSAAATVPVEEASLLRQLGLKLQSEPPVSADLALFQQHFVLYHLLYRLQQDWQSQQVGYLHISLASVQLLPVQDIPLSEEDCSRRDYYLNWQHFYSMTERLLDEQLSAFWQYFIDQRPSGAVINPDEATAALGLSAGFTLSELKRAYRSLALQHHPDRGGNGQEFVLLTEAYQLLLRHF